MTFVLDLLEIFFIMDRKMDQVNGECEEFFLLADADRDCLLFEK